LRPQAATVVVPTPTFTSLLCSKMPLTKACQPPAVAFISSPAR